MIVQGSMCKDNGYYNKDYGLLGNYLFKPAHILLRRYDLRDNIRMVFNENGIRWKGKFAYSEYGVDGFQLLSHPSLLPLSSQSDKHHKEPMFLHLLHNTYIFDTSLCLHTLHFRNS